MNVLFLGFLSTDQQLKDLMERTPAMPTQTQNFGWNMATLFNKISCSFISLSSLPTLSYPLDRKLFYKGKEINCNGVDIIQIPFVNVIVLKQFSRLFFLFSTWLTILKKTNFEFVIVHGVHTPYLIFALFLKKIYGVKVVILFTDPPGVILKSDGTLSKMLKDFDRLLIKSLVRNFSCIALSKLIPKDYMPNSKYFILDGFSTSLPSTVKSEKDPFVIIYAGLLEAKYGVKTLIEAVLNCKDNDVLLRVMGAGDLEPYISSLKSKRVEFIGKLSKQAVFSEYQKANLLVNPRPISDDFVKYSFPSKLIEYLSTGVPVLTTQLPSITDDLKEHLYLCGDKEDDFIQVISEIKKMESNKLIAKAQKAREYVNKTRSIDAYSNRINKFLKQL
jgi:glycosyltransferase involved in cell wall biosynthesis